MSFDGNFSEFWQARRAPAARETGRVATRGSNRREARAEQRSGLASLERRIKEAESEKLDLEQQVGQAFENRKDRDGRRLNRQLERVSGMLEDLYEQWVSNA